MKSLSQHIQEALKVGSKSKINDDTVISKKFRGDTLIRLGDIMRYIIDPKLISSSALENFLRFVYDATTGYKKFGTHKNVLEAYIGIRQPASNGEFMHRINENDISEFLSFSSKSERKEWFQEKFGDITAWKINVIKGGNTYSASVLVAGNKISIIKERFDPRTQSRSVDDFYNLREDGTWAYGYDAWKNSAVLELNKDKKVIENGLQEIIDMYE